MKTLTEINLEKSRSGVYKDNPENRRLHRVGQRYGSSGREEDPAATPLNNRSGGSIVNRSGKSKEGAPENKQRASSADSAGEKELKVKVNPDLRVGDTLLDLYSKEDFDTVKNDGHISFWDGGSIVNSIERRDNKWVSKTSSGEKEISSKEVYSLLKKYYDNEKNNEGEGKKLSFYLKFNPKPQPKPQPKPTTASQKKEYIDRVKKMSDDELAHIALGYSAEKYAKANAAYEKAKAAFKKKWGDGLQGMVDRISSMKDVEELLKDSEELGKKLTDAQTSSPYTPETIQALRRRVINQLKKGVSIDEVEVRNFAVQHQRSYWKEKDFTARQGEFLAKALQKDAASRPAAGDMGDLYNTESTLEKYFNTKLSAKEFNKLVNMVAEHQGRKPNRMRGESTIGGYEDFKRVMSNLDTEDGGESKVKEKEGSRGEKETFTRVNFADMPNAHKVNLKKYLSSKRRAVVDKQFEQVERSAKKGTDFSEALKGMVEKFNNDFEGMSKAERAERLYAIMRMKNILEKK